MYSNYTNHLTLYVKPIYTKVRVTKTVNTLAFSWRDQYTRTVKFSGFNNAPGPTRTIRSGDMIDISQLVGYVDVYIPETGQNFQFQVDATWDWQDSETKLKYVTDVSEFVAEDLRSWVAPFCISRLDSSGRSFTFASYEAEMRGDNELAQLVVDTEYLGPAAVQYQACVSFAPDTQGLRSAPLGDRSVFTPCAVNLTEGSEHWYWDGALETRVEVVGDRNNILQDFVTKGKGLLVKGELNRIGAKAGARKVKIQLLDSDGEICQESDEIFITQPSGCPDIRITIVGDSLYAENMSANPARVTASNSVGGIAVGSVVVGPGQNLEIQQLQGQLMRGDLAIVADADTDQIKNLTPDYRGCPVDKPHWTLPGDKTIHFPLSVEKIPVFGPITDATLSLTGRPLNGTPGSTSRIQGDFFPEMTLQNLGTIVIRPTMLFPSYQYARPSASRARVRDGYLGATASIGRNAGKLELGVGHAYSDNDMTVPGLEYGEVYEYASAAYINPTFTEGFRVSYKVH
jgi:hypothetical protein